MWRPCAPKAQAFIFHALFFFSSKQMKEHTSCAAVHQGTEVYAAHAASWQWFLMYDDIQTAFRHRFGEFYQQRLVIREDRQSLAQRSSSRWSQGLRGRARARLGRAGRGQGSALAALLCQPGQPSAPGTSALLRCSLFLLQ